MTHASYRSMSAICMNNSLNIIHPLLSISTSLWQYLYISCLNSNVSSFVVSYHSSNISLSNFIFLHFIVTVVRLFRIWPSVVLIFVCIELMGKHPFAIYVKPNVLVKSLRGIGVKEILSMNLHLTSVCIIFCPL